MVDFIAIATRVMLGVQEERIRNVEDVPHVGVKVWSDCSHLLVAMVISSPGSSILFLPIGWG